MDLNVPLLQVFQKSCMFLVKELYNYSFLRSGWTTYPAYNKLSKLIQQPKETTRSILIASHVNKMSAARLDI